MRKVNLRMYEFEKYTVIKNLVDNKGNKNRAALKLGISRRQVDRLIAKYKEKGKSAFIHGNRNRKPSNTYDKSLSEDILLLYRNKYNGFNFKHFHEYLEEEENIKVSYNYVYNLLTSNGIISPAAEKRTRKEFKKQQLIKEKKLQEVTEEEIEIIVKREIALEDAHPRQERAKYFGEVIQQDGSIHNWFGDGISCLHLAADYCTNTIVGGYFDTYETLNGYYNVFEQILNNYGIPNEFLTDNKSVFYYQLLNESKRTSEKDVLTQFGYSCKTLGVELNTTSVSQAKGLIERNNGTFQGRLVNELKLNGITDIDKANDYLINVFITKFNKKFALDYTKFESVFEKAPSKKEINYILAVLTPRKIDNGNSIKFKNSYYMPYKDDELVCYMPKTECLVIEAFNKELLVSIEDKVYELRKVKKHKKVSEAFDIDDNITVKPKKKKYTPPMNHPWRVKNFKNQIDRSRNKKVYAG